MLTRATSSMAAANNIILAGWNPNSFLDDCPQPPGLHPYRLDAKGAGQISQYVTVEVLAA